MKHVNNLIKTSKKKISSNLKYVKENHIINATVKSARNTLTDVYFSTVKKKKNLNTVEFNTTVITNVMNKILSLKYFLIKCSVLTFFNSFFILLNNLFNPIFILFI